MWIFGLVTAATAMAVPASAACQSSFGPEAKSMKRNIHLLGKWLPGQGLARGLCSWEESYKIYHTAGRRNSKDNRYSKASAYNSDHSFEATSSNKNKIHSSVIFASGGSSRRDGTIPTLLSDEVDSVTPWQPNQAELLPSRQRGRRGRVMGGNPLNGLFGGALTTWTGKFVALNVAGFAIQMFYPGFTRWGAKVSDYIFRDHEWHRLISPIFLHGGLSHLAVNSVSLINVGPSVEGLFGKSRFVATYLAAGIAGNVASALLSPSRPSVGASGAIFGLIGAYYTFLYVNQPFFGESGKRGRRAMQQTLVMNMLYGLSSPNIDNWGHIGGALGGAAMAFGFGPRLFLYDDYYNRRRIIVDKPILRVPKTISDAPSKLRMKLRRQRRKIYTDRYISPPTSSYQKRYR